MMTRRMRPALPLLALLAIAPAAAAQAAWTVPPPDHPGVRAALDAALRAEPAAVQEQIEICEIAAPPFREARRAEDYRRRMEALGLRNVRIDPEGNVIGERPGADSGAVVVISGHLDTVFPEGTDVTVRRDGTMLRGPGIGDDCRGLAVVLAVARALHEARLETRATVVFVGTVGEEGAGNLRGVRHLFEHELRGRVGAFLSIDGTGLSFVKDAVGSHRYTVSFEGPGGHSYGDFGVPNPLHALGRAIAKIAAFEVPVEPRVTFSVGVVEGGSSVNSIAAAGRMQVDMRSVHAASLQALDDRFQAAIRAALDEENARWSTGARLTMRVDTIGIRPAGTQPEDAPIVRAARATAAALGIPHSPAGAASTDANLPLSLGIPSLTLDAGGRGGGAHSLAEWYDTADSYLGTQWALLTVLALAGLR
jgi:tripeptide aminopeptidase